MWSYRRRVRIPWRFFAGNNKIFKKNRAYIGLVTVGILWTLNEKKAEKKITVTGDVNGKTKKGKRLENYLTS